MKKYLATVILFFTILPFLHSQEKVHDHDHDSHAPIAISDTLQSPNDTVKDKGPAMYGWKIDPRFGERIFLPMDTAVTDFHQSLLVDGLDVAMGYLGNVGSPAQSKIYFNRPEAGNFVFSDAMSYWYKNPEDKYFRNTKVPYSNVIYQTAGGGETAEQRLQTEISMNFGKKLNVGFDFDYVYSRGHYTSLSNKQMSYDFYASYIGDRYKMHAYVYNNNFNNIENGGISNPLYITNPDADEVGGYNGNSLNIPVRMEDTWNKMRGRHVYLTNRYDLGNDKEEYMLNDTTKAWRKKQDYVPLASVILTTHYADQRRNFISRYIGLDALYPNYQGINGDTNNVPKYDGNADDYMAYYSLKNTLALAMNEGFRKWTKFGLTAFAEYELRKYSLPGSLPGLHIRDEEKVLNIGGVLSKTKGEHLTYKASAEMGFLDNVGYALEGEITTKMKVFGKELSVSANAYIKDQTQSYFLENFSSKYWNWTSDDTNFNNTKKVYIGGEIEFPELSFSQTRISGGVENVTDYIYGNSLGLPQQHSGSVRVISLRLDQNFKAGIFHWDNQIVYQYSDNKQVIPLPDLSVYSNIYLKTKLAKVLTLQLGVDAHYHTKYYMPGYEPLTMQFYNQQEEKIGNFPIATAYLNLHLKYTRFFVMMYNLADGMGNAQSFSLYRYPVNPRMLKLGLSWRFNN